MCGCENHKAPLKNTIKALSYTRLSAIILNKMVKKMLQLQEILVPLDGSVEAEGVLPYLRDLAPRFGSHVHILGVGIGRKTRRINRLLEDYINRIANSLHTNNIKAEPVICYGTAADKI